MRTKKSSNSNMRFLKGNVIFFALLLLVIMLFTYYAFKGMGTETENLSSCKVTFSESYNGGDCKVYVDDSLLYAGAPHDKTIEMRRYAAGSQVSLYTSDSKLMIVTATDTVVRTLGGDRLFAVGSRDGKVVVDVIEE